MDTEKDMNTEKEGKRNKLQIVVIIALVCIAIILGIVCYWLYVNMNQPEEEAPSGSSIVVNEDTRDPLTNIQDKVEKGMILVKMTQDWVFTDGGAVSNAYLANSERNSYPLRFKITLEDTGEVIMESPDVPVGSCIENFPLSVTLEPGEYRVMIDHQQIEDGEVINTVSTAGTITVQ